MKKWFGFLLFCVLALLTACYPRNSVSTSSPIVRQIVATVESRDVFLRRYYCTDEKMQAVLLCIRMLRPQFTPETDPELLDIPTICLTMTHSDGSKQLYRLKDTSYLQKNTDPWKKVDSSAAADLWRLLWEMESDEEEPLTFHHALPRLRRNWVYPRGKYPFSVP